LFTFLLGLLVWLFPFYILCAAFEAGCLRWLIHGDRGGFMGLTLGAETWRVWSVYWMWVLLNIAFSMALSIVMMVLMGVVAVGAGGDPTATLTVLPVFYVVQYSLMIYFGVRFAPAAATTIARRRFAFFDAWTVTKGRFWALLGSFVLLYLIYAAFGLAMGAVWYVTVLGAAAPDLSGIGTDPARLNQVVLEFAQAYLRSLTEPRTWAILGALQVVGSIVALVFYVATFGINARAAQVALEEGKIKPAV
jgi:hypothetical protein